MAEQVLDLMAMRVSLRRRRWLLVLGALLGAVAGVAVVLWRPPMYASTSLVLLAPRTSSFGPPIERDMDTEVQVARSEVVMAPARRSAAPTVSRREFASRISISSPTPDVLSIVARGATAADAEERAAAVAASAVDYQASATSSLSTAQLQALERREETLTGALSTVREEILSTQDRIAAEDPESKEGKADAAALAQLTAQESDLLLQIDAIEQQKAGTQVGAGATVIQSASPAERPGLPMAYVLAGAGGALLATGLVGIGVILAARRDRRLYRRDDVARALGTPVLGSVGTLRPRDALGWEVLFDSYHPNEVDDLALRRVLLTAGLPATPTPGRGAVRLTVISLADDAGGLSIAPQLAAHAANLGVSTRFVIVDHGERAPELTSACARAEGKEARPGLWLATRIPRSPGVALTVIHVVVDPDEPFSSVKPPPKGLLALSAGSATATQLARAAVWLHRQGGTVIGSVVADPDPADHTTGRFQPDSATRRRPRSSSPRPDEDDE